MRARGPRSGTCAARPTRSDPRAFEDALGLDRELQSWCTGDDGRRPWSVDAMPPLTRSAFVALLERGGALKVEGTPSLVIGEGVRSAADLDAREIEAAVLGRQEQD